MCYCDMLLDYAKLSSSLFCLFLLFKKMKSVAEVSHHFRSLVKGSIMICCAFVGVNAKLLFLKIVAYEHVLC